MKYMKSLLLTFCFPAIAFLIVSCSEGRGDDDADGDPAAEDPLWADESTQPDMEEEEAPGDGSDAAGDDDLDGAGDELALNDAPEEAEEPSGVAAPDFTLLDENPDSATNGQERTLSDARGRVIILYFVSFV